MASEAITQLPFTEHLAQLAEEAAELTQAALKYRRALDGTSPTPMTPEEGRAKLLEETGDVLTCLEAIDFTPQEWEIIENIQKEKHVRWEERLREKNSKATNNLGDAGA